MGIVEQVSGMFPGLDGAAIGAALSGLDIEAVRRVSAERFKLSLWKGEAINGADYAEMFDLGMPFGGGESFVIRDKHRGRVVYFQTFDPAIGGEHAPMTEARAMELGREVAKQLADAATLKFLSDHIMRQLEEK